MVRARQQIEVIQHQLADVVQLLQRLDAAVVVRDPGNARSAEAFEGLRKTILAAGKARRAHIAHLLSLSDSIGRGASLETISERISDFLDEIGLRHVTDVTHPEWFDTTEGEGDSLECLTPAVVDESEIGTTLIRAGTARRVPVPEITSAPPENDTSNDGLADEELTETMPSDLPDSSEPSSEPLAQASVRSEPDSEAKADPTHSEPGEAEVVADTDQSHGEER